jgi:hypothetical protein
LAAATERVEFNRATPICKNKPFIFLLSLAVMDLMLHLLVRRLRPESSGQVKG